jgi:hypothetical protein
VFSGCASCAGEIAVVRGSDLDSDRAACSILPWFFFGKTDELPTLGQAEIQKHKIQYFCSAPSDHNAVVAIF